MRLRFTLLLTALVAACGTPQEQCIRTATRELRTLDRLIAETEANLARGYTYEEHEIMRHEWTRCDDWVRGTPVRMCFEPVWDTVRRPVAIDPEAETRKLEGLQARRKALGRQADAAIAACRARYPETQ
ncbi:hypothetical protein [Defluviimonas sp. SAOS-178_SWC]|uniref:hypothetical protein n=1 Tax=Defluviimonas sp. SAOS-178_SWC TaxID=3121287 RepID=UPI0032217DD6